VKTPLSLGLATLLCLLCLAAGCAHPPPPTAPLQPTKQTSAPPAVAAPKSSPAEVGDPFLDENLDFLEEEAPTLAVADPLVSWNRAVFTFNDRLYFWLLKPLAQGYTWVTPEGFRIRLRTFFGHLGTPLRLTACLLQAKWGAAGDEFARFVLNTVWGAGGFWDPAGDLSGLEPSEEDLGQVLGRYGIGNGLYLVWPFFGPSTLRDSFGLAGDRYLNPVTYLQPMGLSLGVSGLDTLNATSFRIGDYETVINAAMDPYAAIRDGYIQLRQSKVEK
jgi:phospholipid-binding lipoprotein MlaA